MCGTNKLQNYIFTHPSICSWAVSSVPGAYLGWVGFVCFVFGFFLVRQSHTGLITVALEFVLTFGGTVTGSMIQAVGWGYSCH